MFFIALFYIFYGLWFMQSKHGVYTLYNRSRDKECKLEVDMTCLKISNENHLHHKSIFPRNMSRPNIWTNLPTLRWFVKYLPFFCLLANSLLIYLFKCGSYWSLGTKCVCKWLRYRWCPGLSWNLSTCWASSLSNKSVSFDTFIYTHINEGKIN